MRRPQPSVAVTAAAALSISALLAAPSVHAFVPAPSCSTQMRRSASHCTSLNGMKIGDADGWLSDDDKNNGDGTKKKKDFAEFLENGEGEASVKRKKKNGKNGYKGYKVIDNRDDLPFIVSVTTPDPYTPKEKMKSEAKKNTQRDMEKKKHKMGNKGQQGKVSPKHRLSGVSNSDGIASSIKVQQDDGSFHKILGSYQLDKTTNCGDLIEITVGNECREFEVMKARCQYKYAGGRKFVMVRKILEVKERTRKIVEEHLAKSLALSVSDDSSVPDAEK